MSWYVVYLRHNPIAEGDGNTGYESAQDSINDIVVIQIDGREKRHEHENDTHYASAPELERVIYIDHRIGRVKGWDGSKNDEPVLIEIAANIHSK